MPYQSTSERVGADLLLSLTKGNKRRKAVTQMEPAILVNHRLCHSPIKVTSDEDDREHLWSPSSSSVHGIGQLLNEDGLETPSLSFRVSKMGEVDSFLAEAAKRSDEPALPMVPRSRDLDQKDVEKQRIISPTSSNEKPEDDVENRPLQPKSWECHNTRHANPPSHAVWPHHHHAAPAMHHPPPRYNPPYHSSQYPAWGMYGAPVYYNQHHGQHPEHQHGHAALSSQPAQSEPIPTSLSARPDPVAMAKKLNRFLELDWQSVNLGASRCFPLKHPATNRGLVMEQQLPDFSRIVNFPDYMARGRHATDKSGKKHCVMCGNERLSMAARTREDTTHIIPRQNKGVCTSCDVAVWLILDLNTEIKWCKGCKNFRCWVAFGEKGLATKCVRCRQRQKEKYAEKQRMLS